MTSRELGKLARHIIETYPDYYKIYGEREFTWNKIRQYNRNPLLNMNIGADGLKTGFTKEAGYGLVGSAVQNGTRLIVVVNGLRSEKERADEGKRLLDWGFNNFQSGILFAEGQEIADAKVYGGEQSSVPLVAGKAVKLMVPRGGAREDHRAGGLQRPGARAGGGGAEDRHAQGLAQRSAGARSAAAGGGQRRAGSDPQARHRRRVRAGHRLVPRRFPEAMIVSRGEA